jgi:hypothetical protein
MDALGFRRWMLLWPPAMAFGMQRPQQSAISILLPALLCKFVEDVEHQQFEMRRTPMLRDLQATRMSKELGAMVAIERALSDLNDDERARVLAWASARFNVSLKLPKPAKQSGSSNEAADEGDSAAASTLAEFYDQASPTTEGEKVLVVGYWYQYRENAEELDSQTLNAQLKHLGHGVGNITRALEWPKSQKPALMVQKRKEGSTKQARQKFAVTNEGKKYVERMLARKAAE